MRKFIVLSLGLIMLSSCGYKRMGSLTMVSTRNVESSIQYVELARKVEGKTKLKRDDALQEAIDEAVNSVLGGEYMTNVVVYIKGDRMIKVTGDVYGTINQQKSSTPEIKVGDEVTYIDEKQRKLFCKIKAIEGDKYLLGVMFTKKEIIATRDQFITKKGQ